jgi:hypothetical protein
MREDSGQYLSIKILTELFLTLDLQSMMSGMTSSLVPSKIGEYAEQLVRELVGEGGKAHVERVNDEPDTRWRIGYCSVTWSRYLLYRG